MENSKVIEEFIMISPAVVNRSNNFGIEARIASAIELPHITRRDTSNRLFFFICTTS